MERKKIKHFIHIKTGRELCMELLSKLKCHETTFFLDKKVKIFLILSNYFIFISHGM